MSSEPHLQLINVKKYLDAHFKISVGGKRFRPYASASDIVTKPAACCRAL